MGKTADLTVVRLTLKATAERAGWSQSAVSEHISGKMWEEKAYERQGRLRNLVGFHKERTEMGVHEEQQVWHS